MRRGTEAEVTLRSLRRHGHKRKGGTAGAHRDPSDPASPQCRVGAFTGPEIRNAFEIAAIGRRIDTAKVRRTPIWPASAEWYSWFASNKSQSRKQSSPTPSMRPADALRLWSVGAPSALASLLSRAAGSGRGRA